MNAFLYFLIKFYPIWCFAIIFILAPISYNALKAKKYLKALFVFFIILTLFIVFYFYISYDGYNQGVKFIKDFLIS